jgi:hypothetical protein
MDGHGGENAESCQEQFRPRERPPPIVGNFNSTAVPTGHKHTLPGNDMSATKVCIVRG